MNLIMEGIHGLLGPEGAEIKLEDLSLDDKGYDGYAFEKQYALAARSKK